MGSILLLLCIINAWSGLVSADDVRSWYFTETLSSNLVEKTITPSPRDKTTSIFKLTCNCESGNMEDHVQFNLMGTTPGSVPIMSVSTKCSAAEDNVHFSQPQLFDKTYSLHISGFVGITYIVQLDLDDTDIAISEQKGSTSFAVPRGDLVVKTFDVSGAFVQDQNSSHYSYIDVTVGSPDKYVDNTDDSGRFVGKLFVTQSPAEMQKFYSDPGSKMSESMQLSFTTFGRITVSGASRPALASGMWIVGVLLEPDGDRSPQLGETPDFGRHVATSKKIEMSVEIVTDYNYSRRIGVLFLVSLLGVLIPVVSRLVFDAGHLDCTNISAKSWLLTVKNWFWSGNKGVTYFTALVALMLIVSAFQVTHAKHRTMVDTGNRDICYYNEKCFRPYTPHYDASVNGISSNLPFMIHGLILILYFSICEAYCRSNDHEHFDYAIPYSFGMAFICEGFGSLIYHICPSQIIFQFDTLFMFIICIISIMAIYEGYSVRDGDIRHSVISRHKSIRPPKVFALIIGPIYFFNFIGNLISSENDGSKTEVTIAKSEVTWQGLPFPLIVVFYVAFFLWWMLVLGWVAYKISLCPCGPRDMPALQDSAPGVKEQENALSCYSLPARTFLFLCYATVVIAGFVLTLQEKLPFSLYILGMLVIALFLLLIIFFTPSIWNMVMHFRREDRRSGQSTCLYASRQSLVICGMILYLLAACGIIAIALVFFTKFAVTDKSVAPWKSREMNGGCFLDDFYDAHDFWHLLASFGLMLLSLICAHISKPCRDCYLSYCERRSAAGRRTRGQRFRT